MGLSVRGVRRWWWVAAQADSRSSWWASSRSRQEAATWQAAAGRGARGTGASAGWSMQASWAKGQRCAKTQTSSAGHGRPSAGGTSCSGRTGRSSGARLDARRRGDQQRRVRVRRVLEHLLDRALLDDPAAVEHGDPVGDPGQRAEVVGDDDDREPELAAQPVEQAQHVVAVGGVERADRLVAEQQPRDGSRSPGRSRPAGADRRRSAAVPVDDRLGVEADRRSDSVTRSARSRRDSVPAMSSGSRTSSATVRSGSSERSGSWKTSCTGPSGGTRAAPGRAARRCPRRRT